MYKIIFVYNDSSEIIDTVEIYSEAIQLKHEYKLAFRNIKGCEVYLCNENDSRI